MTTPSWPAGHLQRYYARVTIKFFGYLNTAKGVGCGLGNVIENTGR
jgi:hypothetical protein